jgi:hypothetical protein
MDHPLRYSAVESLSRLCAPVGADRGTQRRAPGFEPHQPVPRGTDASTDVRLTCMLATDVCCDVQVYAHRL